MTRDLARAMVTTIELYLVYGAHLGPLWRMNKVMKLWWSAANFSHPSPNKIGF
jgi:hypothetical protein